MIKDIARKLGISISTVSRSLRNFPEVNPETRRAVLEMAEKLDYQPNYIATSLVKKKTNTIGIVIPSFVIYYYASAISGIINAIVHRDYAGSVTQVKVYSDSLLIWNIGELTNNC